MSIVDSYRDPSKPIVAPPDQDFGSHRGNILLRPQGIKQGWTEQQISEWLKCKADPIYFINNYVRIISEKGIVPFELRDYQKEMVETVFHNRFTLIGTARQAGKSTTVSGLICHFIIFNDVKNVAILANKEATAIEILSKVQLAYSMLPKWIQHGVVEWNKKSCQLENMSRVFAAATSADSIRGYSIDFLFIDEAAHIDGWDAFYTSTYPVISARPDSKVVLVSTPKGMNHFHKLWEESVQGKNTFKRVEVTWHRIPGRDEKWRLETLQTLGNDSDKFAQEYEMQFLGSSGTLIAGWKLKEMVWQTPIYEKEGLRKYFDPEKGHQYALCADVSEGKGLDHSAFSVIDVTKMPYQQVCTYKSNQIGASDYASEIYQTARLYNGACVLIETNIALGPEVAGILHNDFEYDHVLFTASNGATGRKLTSGFGDANVEMGLRSTVKSKATGCSVLKMLIEGNQLIINDHPTYQELTTFSRDPEKAAKSAWCAEKGKHDDTVMALVVFAWLSTQNYFQQLTDIHTLSNLREKTDEDLMSEVMPFGFHSDGLPETEAEGPLFPVTYSWG